MLNQLGIMLSLKRRLFAFLECLTALEKLVYHVCGFLSLRLL